MAYDTHLEERISHVLKRKRIRFEVKKMMGGLCYLVDGKMLCGIVNNELMARVSAEAYETCLALEGAKVQASFAKPMRGYVFVDGDALDLDSQLEQWLNRCLEFNPIAKSSKRK